MTTLKDARKGKLEDFIKEHEGEYLKLCVWRSAHAVKTGHLLNRSG